MQVERRAFASSSERVSSTQESAQKFGEIPNRKLKALLDEPVQD